MADSVTYEQSLTYPKIDAVAGAKLAFTRQQILRLKMRSTVLRVSGVRATTSDPWNITITEVRNSTAYAEFAKPASDVNPDTFGWKSMADLALKEHGRPASGQTWEMISQADMPIVHKGADNKWTGATEAEMKAVLECKVDNTGAFSVGYIVNADTKLAVKNVIGTILEQVLTDIVSDTTHTVLGGQLPYIAPELGEEPNAEFVYRYKPTKFAGTDGLSIGNYGLGQVKVRMNIPAFGNYSRAVHIYDVDAGKAFVVPSVILDVLRRAVGAEADPVIDVILNADDKDLNQEWALASFPASSNASSPICYLSAADPGSVIEVDFDQSNSLNILAAAAFAGLTGALAGGVTTELITMLQNSPLNNLFGQAATALGTTTMAVITGYASALVASYTQGWITNEQLFDLSCHTAWITGGLKAIVGAASAGVIITQAGTLLNYLGVTSPGPLSVALNAVGGAATSSGVALGVASVMANAVKHVYWGE